MSLAFFVMVVIAIMLVVVAVIVGAIRYWERRRPPVARPPEPVWLRVLYGIAAPILAFAIVTMIIIMLIAGPCGLEFGFSQGVIVLAFGGILIPVFAAVLAFGLALYYGRRFMRVEGAFAAVVAVVIVVYALVPHQGQPSVYNASDRCQVQGP